jgi:chain length determinant protein (polysaccharide antigen chain regulator)
VTQETLFLLGSEGLKSMIDNEASRPLVFPTAYYQTKRNLLDIQNLNVNPDTIHVYRYVMKPDLPVRRDSPKKADSGSRRAAWRNDWFRCGTGA